MSIGARLRQDLLCANECRATGLRPIAVDVTVGDVHAAYIAYGAVDYNYFAVVAPVYARGEVRECHAEKWMDHYAPLREVA